ncbi:bacterio-opsin activator [Acidianus sulfidivorans JP7]|uniref:Bacterio-opsin activator n=1 Tax=Acidianus sulfidivorans JP7 TaxID=619593 RepID=A0A2U9ILL6_9CREN|nr:helix-turn-helix domain-containing protein [Acidianus sulfidivorans]AWR96916.1 bacterio-opsin activator [Acidianus sulfidivorans JP7]
MLKKVYIAVEHDDCWTAQMPINASTINLEVYPHKNYLRSRILIESKDREILNIMRSHHTILKILNTYRFKDSIYVDFLNKYRDSIAGLLYDNEVLILGNNISNGEEIWTFATSNKNIKQIIKEVENIGKIKDLRVFDLDLFISPDLTDIETKVLQMSYKYGYLEYPRKISADQMAEKLGLSKVTFLYHLRNAQKKITKFILKNNEL